jgi:hypothetical protein
VNDGLRLPNRLPPFRELDPDLADALRCLAALAAPTGLARESRTDAGSFSSETCA